MTEKRHGLTRRQLLAAGAGAAAAGPALAGVQTAPASLLTAPRVPNVRIGFVGVGGMGTVHVRNLLAVHQASPGVEIRAVCDIRPENAERARDFIREAGGPDPTLYTRGERDYERMCAEEELDLVFTATPWRFHVPVCVAAMENGKHAATEVPAATTIDECWQLVETAERTGRHCVMMENCNYGRWEMMVFHMVRMGVFGEVLHAEGGYLHDLREVKFANRGEGLWRRAHSRTRNANLYPTHGLGPVANCMDIGRGDRFDYLVSMSGPSRGLQDYAREHFPEGAPQQAEEFTLGDVNLSLIKTARGRTITVVHDTNLPRPYSRINLVQGTRGIFQGYPNRIYVEGRSESHRWDDAEAWYEEYAHPLWRNVASPGEDLGHGRMDYLEDYRLIRCLQEGLPTEMNVYDAAALSAVTDLSERSVADRSRPMDFPDFTRGAWETFPKLPVVSGLSPIRCPASAVDVRHRQRPASQRTHSGRAVRARFRRPTASQRLRSSAGRSPACGSTVRRSRFGRAPEAPPGSCPDRSSE